MGFYSKGMEEGMKICGGRVVKWGAYSAPPPTPVEMGFTDLTK